MRRSAALEAGDGVGRGELLGAFDAMETPLWLLMPPVYAELFRAHPAAGTWAAVSIAHVLTHTTRSVKPHTFLIPFLILFKWTTCNPAADANSIVNAALPPVQHCRHASACSARKQCFAPHTVGNWGGDTGIRRWDQNRCVRE